jgi:transcription antitermination factor NusG
MIGDNVGGRDVTVAGFRPGDRVVVKDGTFRGMTGSVIQPCRPLHYGLVNVELVIWATATPVEFTPDDIRHA